MTISCSILMRHFKFFFCYLKSWAFAFTFVAAKSYKSIFMLALWYFYIRMIYNSCFDTCWLKSFFFLFSVVVTIWNSTTNTLPELFTLLFVRVLLKFKRYLMDVSHCKALMSINHARIETLITTSIQAFIVTGKWLISFDMSGARYLCKRDMLNGRWNHHRSPLFHHSCEVCHSLFV